MKQRTLCSEAEFILLLVRRKSWFGFVATALIVLVVNAGAAQENQRPLFAPAPGSPITVGDGPGNVLMGDVNGDGKIDLVATLGGGRRIAVLLGQGDGQFRPARGSPIPVPDPPSDADLGDVNDDGRLDLAIASHDSYGVMLLLGDGSGGFTLAPTSPIMMKDGRHPHTHGLALSDLNHDGKLDLVTVNNADDDVSVALGDGRGGFAIARNSPFAVGKSPYPLTVGDLNGDGHPDIVATSTARGPNDQNLPSTRALTLLFGDGRGGFRSSQVPIRTVLPWFVAIGDVNGDHRPDMVVSHAERIELTVLTGDGGGGFTETAGSPFDLGHSAWSLALVDVNRDGKADVVAAAGDGLRVMLGDGQGGFKPAPGSPFPAGKGAWRLAVGDVNGDGKTDATTSNVERDNITVLLAQ